MFSDIWGEYNKGDYVLMNPTEGEWVHFINERFVQYLNNHKIEPRKKQEKPWVGKIVQFYEQVYFLRLLFIYLLD